MRERERERSQTRDRCTCSLTESIKVRGYCAKLPEDKRVNTEPLLWSFCRSLRDKRAGAGFFPPSLPPSRPGRFAFCNARAANGANAPPPGDPDKLLCPYIQAPQDPQTTVGANRNDSATDRGEEEHRKGRDVALLQLQARVNPCLLPFSPAAAVVCHSPRASRKSLGFVRKATLKSSVGVHGIRVSHPSRVCFQGILPKRIATPGTAPEASCHFTALQLLTFISVLSANLPEHSLPLTITYQCVLSASF